MDQVKDKTCTRCHKAFPRNTFPKNSHNKDGYNSWCSKCSTSHGSEIRRLQRAKMLSNVSPYAIPGVHIKTIGPSGSNGSPLIERIKEAISKVTGLTWDEILNTRKLKSGPRATARARHLFAYITKVMAPHLSLNEIGKLMGGNHHTTVMYGINTIEGYISINDDETMQQIQQLKLLFSNIKLSDNATKPTNPV